jgi:hypothetical protein
MLPILVRALKAVRIVDSDGTLSISSVLLGGAGACVVAQPTWPGVVALLIAAGLYAQRKHLRHDTADKDETLTKLAEDLASAGQKLTALESLPERVQRIDNRTRHLAEPRR